MLALAGREDDVRTELARGPLPPQIDDWHVTSEAGVRAVVAALLDDRVLARDAVEPPAPGLRDEWRSRASRSSPARSTATSRLALAVLGEREEATALAERAEALASRWRMTAYLRWFAEERNRLGF